MKELSTEEKAKAYDKAIERARKLYERGTITESLGHVFPELKESEDEKIRKEMIFYFTEEIPQCSIQEHSYKMREFISWLKRQEVERTKLELKAGNSYFCYKSRWERSDSETFKKGLIYKCNKDGVLDNFVIKNPEQHFIEIKDERIAWLEKQRNKDEEILVLKDQIESLHAAIKALKEVHKIELEKQEQKPNQCENCSIATNNCQKFPCAIRDGEQKTADKVESIEWSGKINSRNAKGVLKEMLDKKLKSEVEPKFTNGDWITNGDYTWKIVEVRPLDYIIQSQDGNIVDDTISYVDENFHIWTIQDVKDGDVLVSNQIIILFKSFEEDSDCNFVIAYAGIDISGKLQITNEHWLISNEVKPATKEQRDLLFSKMKEAGCEWDAEKKELKKISQEYPLTPDECIKPTWREEDKVKDNWEFIHEFVEKFGRIPKDEDELNVLVEYVLKRQKPTEWGEEDEKMLNLIIAIFEVNHPNEYFKANELNDPNMRAVYTEEIVTWLESLKDKIQPQPKQEWKQENTGDLTDFENAMMHIGDSFFGQHGGLDPNDTNAIKEQANILLGLIQKQEWSEEDEKKLLCICAWIKDYPRIADFKDEIYTVANNYIDWLKSLRYWSQWKPSDEQMNALRYVTNFDYGGHKATLVSLYEQLKKLKEY